MPHWDLCTCSNHLVNVVLMKWTLGPQPVSTHATAIPSMRSWHNTCRDNSSHVYSTPSCPIKVVLVCIAPDQPGPYMLYQQLSWQAGCDTTRPGNSMTYTADKAISHMPCTHGTLLLHKATPSGLGEIPVLLIFRKNKTKQNIKSQTKGVDGGLCFKRKNEIKPRREGGNPNGDKQFT